MRRPGSIHWAWIVLATCFMDLFINYSVRLGYGVVLPEMIETLGFSRTAGGSIYNSYLLCYLAFTPVTGYLTDRLGARRVITTCSLILGLGVLLMGTIDTLWRACLYYALAGLGATGMWTPVITVVQRWFAPHRRGLALGILSTGYGLGFAAMGALFPWVVHHFNWRYAWYFLGAGAMAMAAANGVFLRSDPAGEGATPWGQKGPHPAPRSPRSAGSGPGGAGALIFRNPNFWIIGVSYFCVAYSLYGITTFMVDYAKYQMGLSTEKASLLATVHGFAQVAGVLTILPLSDVLGRKRTIILSNAFITCALGGILFSGGSWKVLFVLVGVLALFYGATFPIYGACAGDYFPRRVMGTVIGSWTPFYGLGAVLSHWVTGMLRDATGQYDRAFLINALLATLGLVFISLVRKGGLEDGHPS
ncbi:MAG: MFS transporter [Deltaproteobacteria bacterium]|nr:MFS transporter [Deltaproteobacteria bacterium]